MKVIETMTMFDGYVHGYRPRENTRLHDQADTLAELLHGDTGFPAGRAVLEVGCGVGAQTVTVAERSPGAALTAIDLSAASLAAARKRARDAGHRDITFVQADVHTLPHPAGPLAAATFDRIFVCFHRTGSSATRSSRPPRASSSRLRRGRLQPEASFSAANRGCE